MGDWIIRQLIAKEGNPRNASLTGKLIICDSKHICTRLQMLLDAIVGKIEQASAMPRDSASQATFIGTFRQFI